MNKESLEKYKTALMQEKKRIEGLLSKVAHMKKGSADEKFDTDFPNMGDSMDDNAQEVTQYASNLGEEKVLEDRLRKMNSAFSRIEEGTYGKCTVGGEDIEVKRLEVAPEVETCVKHAN